MVAHATSMRLTVVSLVSLVVLSSSICYASTVDTALINVDVEREIDLTSQVGIYVLDLKMENTGSTAATEFLLAVPASMAKNLAYIE
eukprot:224074-Pyramimonas_sp.AAC.1